jgi:DNA-binding MarR family transcriptional regulator
LIFTIIIKTSSHSEHMMKSVRSAGKKSDIPQPPQLDMTAEDRSKRYTSKKLKILNFLSTEQWITADEVLAELLGTDVPNAWAFVRRLENRGLVTMGKSAADQDGEKRTVVCVTQAGISESEVDEANACLPKKPWRVRVGQIRHRQACWRLRMAAEMRGFKDFEPDDLLKAKIVAGLPKRQAMKGCIPDYIGKTPGGRSIAFEVEMTPKELDRYKEIFPAHIIAITVDNRFNEVIYFSPADNTILSLQRIFQKKIHSVFTYKGWEPLIDFQRLFKFIRPCDLDRYLDSFKGVDLDDI